MARPIHAEGRFDIVDGRWRLVAIERHPDIPALRQAIYLPHDRRDLGCRGAFASHFAVPRRVTTMWIRVSNGFWGTPRSFELQGWRIENGLAITERTGGGILTHGIPPGLDLLLGAANVKTAYTLHVEYE